jgi:hypothetical protein
MSDPTTSPKQEDGLPLSCSIEAQSKYQLGNPVIVKGTLHNSGSSDMWVLRASTFLTPDWSGSLRVSHDGAPVSTTGAALRSRVVNKDSYERIPAGQSLSREIDIRDKYAVTEPGDYETYFLMPVVGAFESGNGEPPVDQREYKLTRVESEKVTFRIEGVAATPAKVAASVDLPTEKGSRGFPEFAKAAGLGRELVPGGAGQLLRGAQLGLCSDPVRARGRRRG